MKSNPSQDPLQRDALQRDIREWNLKHVILFEEIFGGKVTANPGQRSR